MRRQRHLETVSLSILDIDRAAVLQAIDEFDEAGRDGFLKKYGYGEAKRYFLRQDGNLYDSKAIFGVARGYARPDLGAMKYDEHSGGLGYVVPHLKGLGFEILDLEALAAEPKIEGRSFWWVNNKQTYKHEVDGGYLWSPLTRSDGGRHEFYENMKRVRPGDVVFSFANAQLRAVGVCVAPAILMPKPTEFGVAGSAWLNEGWRVPVSFSKLDQPLRVKDHMGVLAPTLPEKYSPIQANGDGNQGAYLAAVPAEMAEILIRLLGGQWDVATLDAPVSPQAVDIAIDQTEAEVEKAISNRTDIGETKKLRLVQSRRGQGIYRSNLVQFEKACRVTGVTNLQHLRASHIKPWAASTDFEKLDGNNGLLLSPHIDHLFDRGYLSFTDDGSILLGIGCDEETLAKWQIEEGTVCGPFRAEQLPYLSYHRKFILKKAA